MYGQNLSFGMIEVMSRVYDYTAVPNGMKIFRDYDYEDSDMESFIYLVWRGLYANIAAINNILEWSDRNASVLSEARRNQVKGEALALRAMHHYDVYRLFAPDATKMPGFYPGRISSECRLRLSILPEIFWIWW